MCVCVFMCWYDLGPISFDHSRCVLLALGNPRDIDIVVFRVLWFVCVCIHIKPEFNNLWLRKAHGFNHNTLTIPSTSTGELDSAF